jgi:hypothetical protein
MFKRTILLTATLLSALAWSAMPAMAQDDTAPAAKQKKAKPEKKAASPVVTAVKKVSKVKGRVNEKADYFIFLYSASWCGPCCKEMPEIVKTYKDIKKSGKVDIILFCQDRTEADAKSFVNRFRIKFLTVMGNDKKCAQVPGHASPGGIPHCNIVDRNGRTIIAGHPGNVLEHWKEYTIDMAAAENEE